MSVHDYIPMKGPLPGEHWKPSNDSIGQSFIAGECARCERDKVMNGTVDDDDAGDDDLCPILGASFRGEAVEWRRMPDRSIRCLAFVPMGDKVPARDDFTVDMFAGAEGAAA